MNTQALDTFGVHVFTAHEPVSVTVEIGDWFDLAMQLAFAGVLGIGAAKFYYLGQLVKAYFDNPYMSVDSFL